MSETVLRTNRFRRTSGIHESPGEDYSRVSPADVGHGVRHAFPVLRNSFIRALRNAELDGTVTSSVPSGISFLIADVAGRNSRCIPSCCCYGGAPSGAHSDYGTIVDIHYSPSIRAILVSNQFYLLSCGPPFEVARHRI